MRDYRSILNKIYINKAMDIKHKDTVKLIDIIRSFTLQGEWPINNGIITNKQKESVNTQAELKIDLKLINYRK